MMIAIPDVLDAETLARVRAIIDAAPWVDGNVTSGYQSALAKRNMQLPEDSAAAREAGSLILDALGKAPLFIAAALPLKVYPPLFNSYEGGQTFGVHIDNAIRIQRGTEVRIRSDLSATLFLEDPDAYDGGELTVEDQFGVQPVKLPAGHMVLYPASSLHRVEPVAVLPVVGGPEPDRCWVPVSVRRQRFSRRARTSASSENRPGPPSSTSTLMTK